MSTEFWKRVNFLIKKTNKTQNSLSVECGFPERRINNLSATNTYPRADESVAIARALGTSVEFLVLGEAPSGEIPGDVVDAFLSLQKSLEKYI